MRILQKILALISRKRPVQELLIKNLSVQRPNFNPYRRPQFPINDNQFIANSHINRQSKIQVITTTQIPTINLDQEEKAYSTNGELFIYCFYISVKNLYPVRSVIFRWPFFKSNRSSTIIDSK